MDWNARRVRELIDAALHEDRTVADATSRLTVAADQEAQAAVVAKQECVLAGLDLTPRVFAAYNALLPAGDRRPPVVVSHNREVFDGVRLAPGQVVAVLRGNARQLLACERVLLNFLQHLSGVATLTRQFVAAVQGTRARILDTRKTLPGWRALEKYAVTCGGGVNHRGDLSAGVLIKNYHIRLAGGVAAALRRALESRGHAAGMTVEIEVRTAEELETALAGGAQRILLDNMTPDQVRAAVATTAGRAELEVSGGVNLATVRAYAETGVDFISVGALTHSAPAVDLAMRIAPV